MEIAEKAKPDQRTLTSLHCGDQRTQAIVPVRSGIEQRARKHLGCNLRNKNKSSSLKSPYPEGQQKAFATGASSFAPSST
ncbi:hypothetical protein AAY473_012310 [Plecturocebus cupreus]